MYYKKFFLFTNYFIMPKKIVMYNRKGVQGTKEEKQETQSSNVNSIIKAIITTNYTRWTMPASKTYASHYFEVLDRHPALVSCEFYYSFLLFGLVWEGRGVYSTFVIESSNSKELHLLSPYLSHLSSLPLSFQNIKKDK